MLKVSVVVPVYNCRSTLERALGSVFAQTLGMDRIELIAVDDGSTDGSAAELDRLAAAHRGLVVIHQPNSGGPGGPRNTGLDRATGEYVFFLDADDWLGPEALERMCAMADEHRTDVVLGKMVGVGRKVPRTLFLRNVPRTTVLGKDPTPYDTLSVLKLYRHTLIDRLGLRFVEGAFSHEDQIFAARAYLDADGISVLADYDCYFWAARDDRSSVTEQGGAEAKVLFEVVGEVMAVVADRFPPGPDRDWLLRRHFNVEIFSRFGPRYLAMTTAEQQATRDGARELMRAWLTPRILAGTTPYRRVVAHCVLEERDDLLLEVVTAGAGADVVVAGGRAYEDLPYLRDQAAGIPSDCYEVTDRLRVCHRLDELSRLPDGRLRVSGEAVVDRVDPAGRTVTLVLARELPEAELRVPCETGAGAAFHGVIDQPGPGLWRVEIEVEIQGLAKRARFGSVRGESLTEPGGNARFGPRGNLVIGVSPLTVDRIVRRRAGFRVTGHTPGPLRAELRRRKVGDLREAVARVDADGRFTIDIGLRGLGSGVWDLCCEVEGFAGRHRVPAAGPLPLRGGAASLYRTTEDALAVRVAPPRVRRIARRIRGVIGGPGRPRGTS